MKPRPRERSQQRVRRSRLDLHDRLPPPLRPLGELFFFYETAPTEFYTSLHTLSLHDALPICARSRWRRRARRGAPPPPRARVRRRDRKSTRLNSSHVTTSRMPSSA